MTSQNVVFTVLHPKCWAISGRIPKSAKLIFLAIPGENNIIIVINNKIKRSNMIITRIGKCLKHSSYHSVDLILS